MMVVVKLCIILLVLQWEYFYRYPIIDPFAPELVVFLKGVGSVFAHIGFDAILYNNEECMIPSAIYQEV
jgi:hypothetical protein